VGDELFFWENTGDANKRKIKKLENLIKKLEGLC
jgi:hypothetical protein